MSILRKLVRYLIDWAMADDPVSPPAPATPEARAEQFALYTAALGQAWTWELEAYKHLLFVGAAGMAGLIALIGAGIFQGNAERLAYAFWAFLAVLLFGYAAIVNGALSLRTGATQRASYHSMSAIWKTPASSVPGMWTARILGFLSLLCLGVALLSMFAGALDGFFAQGSAGVKPAHAQPQYKVKCRSSQVAPAASSPVPTQLPTDLECQISS